MSTTSSPTTASNVIVRDLVASDESQWAQLWAVYLEFYRKELPPLVTDVLWERLTGIRRHPQMHGLAAVDGSGRIIGIAHYVVGPSTWDIRDDAYLEDLVVAEGSRGKGVGRALIETLVARGREHNWRRVFWITDEDNETARRLYDSVGALTEYVQYERLLQY